MKLSPEEFEQFMNEHPDLMAIEAEAFAKRLKERNPDLAKVKPDLEIVNRRQHGKDN